MKVTKENYHILRTHANFTVDNTGYYYGTMFNREPDFVSASGSKYWYSDLGLLRSSTHWGRIDNSTWLLENRFILFPLLRPVYKTGFCRWEDFTILDNE